MSQTAADRMLEISCMNWGVEVIFGLPGMALTESWRRFVIDKTS